jgi:murein L,D-transpeptidase YcbB/YkuD
MKVSNTPTFAGTSWIPYVTTGPWTLGSNSGVETVYAQFQAVGGIIVGSAQASISFAPAGAPAVATSSSVATPAVASSATSSATSLTAELATLQAELAALEQQAGESQPAAPAPAQLAFTRNLSFGMTGNDVKQLQLFLIQQNAGPAARRLKAHGTTRNFATLTLNALMEFQEKAGIKPAFGFFGPITRAYVNSLLP